MALFTFVLLTISSILPGVESATATDYIRGESLTGIVEFHPVFQSTTGFFGLGNTVLVSADTLVLTGTFDFIFTGCTIFRIESGVLYDTVVCAMGNNSFQLHVPHGTILGWVVGNNLNVGIRKL